MDSEQAMALIGMPADNPVLVGFLRAAGAKRLPSWQSFERMVVKLDGGATVLTFASEDPHAGSADAQNDRIYLDDITFTQSPATTLPLGLRWDMTTQEIASVLGEPDSSEEFLRGLMHYYPEIRPRLSLVIKFDLDGKRLQWVRIHAQRKNQVHTD